MQWDGGPHAGFSDVEPWLPLSEDAEARNVDALRDEPDSILTLYRRLLALRREHEALAVGGYRTVAPGLDEVFAYERFDEAATLRIVLNFGGGAHAVPLPAGGRRTVLLSSRPGRCGSPAAGSVELGPAEGLILGLL